jgi:branched-chain amino acid transport system ATP-binding protein
MTPLAAYCSAAVTSPLGLPSRSKRPPPAPYLSVHGLTMAFGGVRALDGVTFAIERGELVGLIGPNGSGKTTLVNILSGHLRPDDGHVELEDRRIDGLRPEILARQGVLRTFQLTRVFPRMSAIDNLVAAGCALGPTQREAERRGSQLMEELSLAGLRSLDAGHLSGISIRATCYGVSESAQDWTHCRTIG